MWLPLPVLVPPVSGFLARASSYRSCRWVAHEESSPPICIAGSMWSNWEQAAECLKFYCFSDCYSDPHYPFLLLIGCCKHLLLGDLQYIKENRMYQVCSHKMNLVIMLLVDWGE